jgi:hypothetical protein
MTRDEIVKMAMRAYGDWFPNVPIPNELERFAALAYEAGAAAEREACAEVCEEQGKGRKAMEHYAALTYSGSAHDCAATIRARE